MSRNELVQHDENLLSISGIRSPKNKNGIVSSSAKAKTKIKDELKIEQTNEVTPFEDLIAGGVAGTLSIFVGHPFDTAKVRLQVGGSRGAFTSLFRGFAAPMSTACAVNAVIFSSYGWSSRVWETTPELEQYNKYKNFFCGCFAGFVQCLIICPVELIKCRLQVQNEGTKTIMNSSRTQTQQMFRGTLDLTSHIATKHGLPTLYRGWNATCSRDIISFGIYFSVYDFWKEAITEKFFTPDNPHVWLASAAAGGFCGTTAWVCSYPMDVIKTSIQTSPFESTRLENRNIWHVGKNLIRERGLSSMFRGLGVTCMRAFPVNGIIFPVYEFTISQLRTWT